jgi:peptidoglycan/xylan/chitin deacetylase (PgdA/CDA1 family)
LPLAEAATRLANGSLPARSACITFDDGYINNLTVAAPILAARGMSATFFITTDFIDGGAMWNDRVTEILRRSRAELDLEPLGLGRYTFTDALSRRTAMRAVLDAIKYLPPARRLERVAQLAERAGADFDERLMMNEQQLRELAALGMDLGAHTLTHPILTRIDETSARREIGASRERLSAILGRPVDLFAYPNGRPHEDYDVRHVKIVRELGFRAAVSTAWGCARAGADAFQLPRIAPWDRTPTRFAARMVRSLLQARPQMVA